MQTDTLSNSYKSHTLDSFFNDKGTVNKKRHLEYEPIKNQPIEWKTLGKSSNKSEKKIVYNTINKKKNDSINKRTKNESTHSSKKNDKFKESIAEKYSNIHKKEIFLKKFKSKFMIKDWITVNIDDKIYSKLVKKLENNEFDFIRRLLFVVERKYNTINITELIYNMVSDTYEIQTPNNNKTWDKKLIQYIQKGKNTRDIHIDENVHEFINELQENFDTESFEQYLQTLSDIAMSNKSKNKIDIQTAIQAMNYTK